MAKSTFDPGPAPQSELQICEPVGSGIKVKIRRIDAGGNATSSEYTANYDSKDYAFPGSPWDTITLKRIDRFTSEAVFKRNGKVVQNSIITVSADGKVLTLRAKGTLPTGKRDTHVEVFDKP